MVFIGHYERTIDLKHRLQIPQPFRAEIEAEGNGTGLYVILGERRHTLSLVTKRQFERLCHRAQTETVPGQDSLEFEQRFYSMTAHLEMDNQGRVVLPEYLTSRARIEGEVVLAGAKNRIDLWRKADYDAFMGIDWEHDWPNWQRFLRGPLPAGSGESQRVESSDES